MVKYWKLDRIMQKSGIEYSIEKEYPLIQISTDPAHNTVTQENIELAMKKDEVLVNSSLGKFSIIQINMQVYKAQKES